MKKIIILYIFLANLIGNAQCSAPSNVIIISYLLPEVTLAWTENGTAVEWDVLVIPYFDIGTPIPTAGWISATTNPFTLVGVPPSACNGFFVRSVCSNTEVSPWAAVGSIACSPNVYNYLATLSTSSFIFNATDDLLNVYPNPTKEILNIVPKNNSPVTSIIIYNTLGQKVTAFVAPANAINISNLKTGTYFIKVTIDNKESVIKFVKE